MITRRSLIKGTGTMCVSAVGALALSSCGGSGSSGASSSASASASSPQSAAATSSSSTAASASGQPAPLGKSVVVFFSRAGENFEVGVVDEGNTARVAHSIAGKVVSDVFEIVPTEEYPFSYDECLEQALAEKSEKARPTLLDDFAGFDEYGTVYLGYPIWHSDLPMIMYTFIESKNWTNKKVMPFCTHGDSGLNDTVATIRTLCKGADVKEGLAIKGSTAQELEAEADSAINAWLAKVRK